VAERILETLWRQVVVFHDQPIQLSTSLGIALFPEHSTVGEELLAHADTAMYQAKAQGRNQLCFYVPDQNWQKRIRSKQAIKAQIHEALEHNLFALYCQPILDLRRCQVTHYELLLRLHGEASHLILPNVFLPIAERYGLIQAIDRWVVVQAIQLIAQHQQRGKRLTLEINLSGKSLADTELLSLIQQQVTSTGINPQQLVFEITETAAIADLAQACKFMEFLKGLGCQFALDDFGIGYSSFFQLKSLPVDYLKIDGSFIRNLPQDQVDRHLVKAIVDASRGLGKRTIAEFVGSEATAELLSELGVDYAQGYYVGQPRPVSEVLPEPL
jgi:EAL domain-containing protein (putative c-di-GMP-specific phosphodiesterase class I)